MPTKKNRTPIPAEAAAGVVFRSDRTCCVCRTEGRPTQIHHIDEDPSNNDPSNLALLCVVCHDATQISGGFGRKLRRDVVVLYRDDWERRVAMARSTSNVEAVVSQRDPDIALLTSIAEIYRRNGELELLAGFYDSIGNQELRDQYIEEVLNGSPSDSSVTFLRGMQGRPEQIPDDVAARQEAVLTERKDWSQRARLYVSLGRRRDAILDYVRTVLRSLEEGRLFSAGYYLKELKEEGLDEFLFTEAMQQFEAEGDLWWQVRCLEELGWHSALSEFVISHADQIRDDGNPFLLALLAEAQGNHPEAAQLRKAIAENTSLIPNTGVVRSPTKLTSTAPNAGGAKRPRHKRH
jgi:hypothetical protein